MFYTSKVSHRSAQMFGVLMLCQLAACNLQKPQLLDALGPAPGALPPVTASSTCYNQPTGYTMAFDTPWNVLPALKPEWSTEGYHFAAGQASTLSIVQVPEAPKSAPNVLRIGFPRGFPGGGAPSRWGSRALPQNHGEIYVCLWLRASSNFSNNGNVGTKLFFIRDSLNNHFIGLGISNKPTDLFPGTGLQFRDNSKSYNLGQNVTAANRIDGGQWHKLEIIWRANTPGLRDGSYRQWVDDVLVSRSDQVLFFLAGQTPQWTYLWFDPTFGGGRNPVPNDQYLDFDHLFVSVR